LHFYKSKDHLNRPVHYWQFQAIHITANRPYQLPSLGVGESIDVSQKTLSQNKCVSITHPYTLLFERGFNAPLKPH
jgi:hypothetical protein